MEAESSPGQLTMSKFVAGSPVSIPKEPSDAQAQGSGEPAHERRRSTRMAQKPARLADYV